MSEQMPDLQSFLAQAQQLQEQLTHARDAAAEQVITGVAAGGKVTVTVTGAMEFGGVHIDPSLLEDVELLEDLVLAALRDAFTKVSELNEQVTGSIFG